MWYNVSTTKQHTRYGGKFRATVYSQLSLADIYKDCQDLFLSDKPAFFSLLENYIDFEKFIPPTFYNAFYQNFGRKRKYPLHAFIASLIFQKVATIPTDSLLILLLHLCKELRDFCGFHKVPDASKFTRFKQEFEPYLKQMFHSLVDYTEPICQALDKNLASSLIFDTSGIEAYVTENNPKYVNNIIKQLKAYHKSLGDKASFDPYAKAYQSMPSQAASNPQVKQLHINGHFCYVHKFAILTNALGIVRHVAFLDEEFKSAHPELIVEKKSDSPDEDKSIGDSSSLQPVLKDFFTLHPNIHPHTFLGDAAFDKLDHYTFLRNDCKFQNMLIPLNPRNSSSLPKVGYNEFGYPLCPEDSSLVMKYHGITNEKGRSNRVKWGCPKVRLLKGQWVCDCPNPCSTAKRGRTTYTNDSSILRNYPGVQRGTPQWDKEYKNRAIIEQIIQHLKGNMCIANRKTSNLATTKADVYLACIASLFTVILADRLKKPEYIRSMKPLIA
ncbi:MAG: transposase [Clostridia bacterium]